jgi:enterochelin esterase family protein
MAAALTVALAQEVGARRGTDITSPEIASDRRVTFRLRAPEAKAVTVSGDFGSDTTMQKGEDGLWSVTIGPLDPEMYVYYFTVDGVRLIDPSNPQVKIGCDQHDDKPVDRPRGQAVLRRAGRLMERSGRCLQVGRTVTRELTVYLPPGYDQANGRRYPVLYLLHGFANDHHSWHRYGRANDILDNLLAQRAILPFLVVMPLGYGGAHVNGDGTGIAPEGSGAFRGDAALYERDLLEDIIPMVDGKYRTIPDRKQRAIVGFSMGGGQAGRSTAEPETFCQVGIMSAGMAPGTDKRAIATLAANRDKTNKRSIWRWIVARRTPR